jgi:ribosomal protein S18 acetylase RimI-like enzyme
VTQEPDSLTERHGPYSLRPARAADLDSLIELLLALQDQIETSNPDLWRMKPDARHNLKGQISARLKAANSCALVAEHEEDGVVGVIFGRIVVNNRYTPSRAGQVDQAFVRADHRRMGVGSRLVTLLCRFFASEDVEDISLRYVVGNEEAAAFWSALGFSPRIITAGVAREALEYHLHEGER